MLRNGPTSRKNSLRGFNASENVDGIGTYSRFLQDFLANWLTPKIEPTPFVSTVPRYIDLPIPPHCNHCTAITPLQHPCHNNSHLTQAVRNETREHRCDRQQLSTGEKQRSKKQRKRNSAKKTERKIQPKDSHEKVEKY